jgi:hypothetical protein
MLQLEKQVHEKKIDQARLQYKDELSKSEEKLEKINSKLA